MVWSAVTARGDGARSLRHRIAFEKRVAREDGYGNVEAEWVEQFVVHARLTARFGGEAVQAQRLAGAQPYTIAVRQSSATLRIQTDWRARDVRSAADPGAQTLFNIRSIADPDGSGRWLELLCQSGVAA